MLTGLQFEARSLSLNESPSEKEGKFTQVSRLSLRESAPQ